MKFIPHHIEEGNFKAYLWLPPGWDKPILNKYYHTFQNGDQFYGMPIEELKQKVSEAEEFLAKIEETKMDPTPIAEVYMNLSKERVDFLWETLGWNKRTRVYFELMLKGEIEKAENPLYYGRDVRRFEVILSELSDAIYQIYPKGLVCVIDNILYSIEHVYNPKYIEYERQPIY